MTDHPDHYKVLQVDPEADPDVMQAAYRRLAQRWHPDVASGPEAAARMVALNSAWETLSDPARRAAYDRERVGAGQALPGTAPRGGARPDPGADSAGPPPGDPSGSVLTFGRFSGWSLGEIARRDLEYIEWLDRTPIGRPYRDEIELILRRTGRRQSAAAEANERHGLFRRR